MIIHRKNVVTLLSILEYATAKISTKDDWESMIKDTLQESRRNSTPRRVLFGIRGFLRENLLTEPNLFLQFELQKYSRKSFLVKGIEPILHPCNCCNYLSLTKKNEYFICNVCFWEDDGVTEASQYSYPNHSTLQQAQENFKVYGVMEAEYLRFVSPNRFDIYEKAVNFDK
jgi:hypothetical protein